MRARYLIREGRRGCPVSFPRWAKGAGPPALRRISCPDSFVLCCWFPASRHVSCHFCSHRVPSLPPSPRSPTSCSSSSEESWVQGRVAARLGAYFARDRRARPPLTPRFRSPIQRPPLKKQIPIGRRNVWNGSPSEQCGASGKVVEIIGRLRMAGTRGPATSLLFRVLV